ncbi:MAG: Lrp/AsnC family transcriptional regulator [Candidatus Bathyarchaeota archaeon]|jgi:DNA-binding Lrp family transcriptional regulator
MKELKPLDSKILFELLRNARVSDRKLAKILGVSQATVSRRRATLEKEAIEGYTAIPKWDKLGYEILSLALVKTRPVFSSKEKYEAVRKRGIGWLMNQSNVIMGGACEGMGFSSFVISLHKSYADYNEFIRKIRLDMGELIDDLQTIIINLSATERIKPLHLKYLAREKLDE